jgi:hypothetical protein
MLLLMERCPLVGRESAMELTPLFVALFLMNHIIINQILPRGLRAAS